MYCCKQHELCTFQVKVTKDSALDQSMMFFAGEHSQAPAAVEQGHGIHPLYRDFVDSMIQGFLYLNVSLLIEPCRWHYARQNKNAAPGEIWTWGICQGNALCTANHNGVTHTHTQTHTHTHTHTRARTNTQTHIAKRQFT